MRKPKKPKKGNIWDDQDNTGPFSRQENLYYVAYLRY